jgi:glutamate-1-semialdehyde aminotransferase
MDRPANIVTCIDTARPKLRAVSSSGARVTLSDGREYIDLMNGKGCITLGHHHPAVSRAIVHHLQNRTASSTCWSDLHEKLADTIISDTGLPGAGLAFYSTGTEACRAAIQACRSLTGKRLVLSAGYHGWGTDWQPSEEMLQPNEHGIVDFYFVPRLLEEALIAFRDRVAMVILSPDYVHLKPETLRTLAETVRRHGVILCCDDVKQGYRSVAASAFPAAAGMHADLYTFAKGLANGLRLSCLVGRSEILAAAKDFTYTAYFDTLPIVASLATLEEMRANDGYRRLVDCGSKLCASLRAAAKDSGLPITIYGDGPMFQVVSASEPLDRLMYTNLAAAGLLLYEGDNQSVSLATENEIEEIVDRFERAMEALCRQLGDVGKVGISDRRRFEAAFTMMDGASDFVSQADAVDWIRDMR